MGLFGSYLLELICYFIMTLIALDVNHCLNKIKETLKLLVFKEQSNLVEKIGMDNDYAYLEPLIFSYFNLSKFNKLPKETLKEILQGYYGEKKSLGSKSCFNKEGIAYIPKLGYFKKRSKTPFLPIQLIKGTKIEILKHSHPLIDRVFDIASGGKINDENFTINGDLYNKNIDALTNAFQFIKSSAFKHFNLIEESCRKCILFKTDPKITNSFATINAHGMAFINVYQDDYDEVFFVDDIAHQTGHIILTTLFFKRKDYFLIDENEKIKNKTGKENEYRSFYVLFHALYTYYTSILCLDKCIAANCFDVKQTHEATGRIGFYLRKAKLDIENFDKVLKFYGGIRFCLTQKGIDLHNNLIKKLRILNSKWHKTIIKLDYGNQPYNFTYKDFVKLNPLRNE